MLLPNNITKYYIKIRYEPLNIIFMCNNVSVFFKFLPTFLNFPLPMPYLVPFFLSCFVEAFYSFSFSSRFKFSLFFKISIVVCFSGMLVLYAFRMLFIKKNVIQPLKIQNINVIVFHFLIGIRYQDF